MSKPRQSELERYRLASEVAAQLDRLASEQSGEARDFARDLRYIIDRGLGERTRPAFGALRRIRRLIGPDLLRAGIEESHGYIVARRKPDAERYACNAEQLIAEEFVRRVRELEHPDELGNRQDALTAAANEAYQLAESYFPDDAKRRDKWHTSVTDRTLRDRYKYWASAILDNRGFLPEPGLVTLFNSAGAPPRHSLVDRKAKPGPKCGSKRA